MYRRPWHLCRLADTVFHRTVICLRIVSLPLLSHNHLVKLVGAFVLVPATIVDPVDDGEFGRAPVSRFTGEQNGAPFTADTKAMLWRLGTLTGRSSC